MLQLSRCKPLLGTVVEVNIAADCDEARLFAGSEKAFQQIAAVQDAMSFHNPNSELSLINRTANEKPHQLSKPMKQVLMLAQDLYRNSGGLFDVSVAPWLVKEGFLPNHNTHGTERVNQSLMKIEGNFVRFEQPLMLDLGGIAKGFAVDLAMAVLSEEFSVDLIQASVNAGGDLRVLDWHDYKVLIPNTHKKLTEQLMPKCAVASSSTYYLAGQSDIYAPETGHQIVLNQTISVFASSCAVADGLTKVAAHLPQNSAAIEKVFNSYDATVVFT